MRIEDLRQFCLDMDGVTEKTPFGKFSPRFESYLVFYVAGHMFCSVDMDDFTFVNVKSTPQEIKDIETNYASVGNTINPTMKDWVCLYIGGDIPDRLIYEFVGRAYVIVKNKYERKQKRQ